MNFRLFVLLCLIIPIGLSAQKQKPTERKLDDAKFNLFHVKDYTFDEGDFALFLSSIKPHLSDKKQNNIIANFDWTSAYLIRKGIECKHVDSLKYHKILKMVDNAVNNFYDIKRVKMVLNFIDSLSPEVLSHTKFIHNVSPFSDFFDKSIVYVIDDIFEGLDANAFLDIDIQSQIDAIRASKDYVYKQYKLGGDYSGEKGFGDDDYNEQVNISSSFDVKSTMIRFLDSINSIDKSLIGKLNKEKQVDWNDFKAYIDLLVKNNIVFFNKYPFWEVSECIVNSLTDDLNFIDKRMNENATNFWMLYNSSNFFDSVLNSERIGISTRTVLKEYYPMAKVNRVWITLDSVFSKVEGSDFETNDTANLIVWQVNPDSMAIVQRLMNLVEQGAYDSTVGMAVDLGDYIPNQSLNSKTFGIEPFAMKFYNNFNEINEVLKSEGLKELYHLNTVGLTFVYQQSDDYTRFRFSYGRNLATDQNSKINETYWGDNFMLSTESAIFNKRFASLSLITNLSYMRNSMTFHNGFQMGDPLVTNPQEIYQVTKNTFLYGLGLNGKIGFSKFYLIGEVGYLWDYGDGRWTYKDKYINGKGNMSNRGLYISVGLGVNIYQKYR
jgi:hypothetical protein